MTDRTATTGRIARPKELTTLPVRFWAKVRQGPGCWEWTAGKGGSLGYGYFHFAGRTVGAHRASYEHFYGPIPEGKIVLHLCDNPPCVNPLHLSVGTVHENNTDMTRKGRHRGQLATECKHGHPFDQANTRIRKNGKRACRACGRLRYTAPTFRATEDRDVAATAPCLGSSEGGNGAAL